MRARHRRGHHPEQAVSRVRHGSDFVGGITLLPVRRRLNRRLSPAYRAAAAGDTPLSMCSTRRSTRSHTPLSMCSARPTDARVPDRGASVGDRPSTSAAERLAVDRRSSRARVSNTSITVCVCSRYGKRTNKRARSAGGLVAGRAAASPGSETTGSVAARRPRAKRPAQHPTPLPREKHIDRGVCLFASRSGPAEPVGLSEAFYSPAVSPSPWGPTAPRTPDPG